MKASIARNMNIYYQLEQRGRDPVSSVVEIIRSLFEYSVWCSPTSDIHFPALTRLKILPTSVS